MRPSWPSVTFPNFYTLVTGLHPDHHGLIYNSMRDPNLPDRRFTLGNRAEVMDRVWYDGGEPIWVTAHNAGLRSAAMFWPGSEAPVRGVRPADAETARSGARLPHPAGAVTPRGSLGPVAPPGCAAAHPRPR